MAQKLFIDVSKHNGKINWEVASKNIDGAIIRIGFGSNHPDQDDPTAIENLKACVKYNIPYDVYLYSYAMNIDDALDEARHVLRVIEGFKPGRVWYDMEDADGYKRRNNLNVYTSKDLITNICKTFCDCILLTGYKTGIYASYDYWINVLDTDRLKKFDRWVAKWGSVKPDIPCNMWQYTDAGHIEGVPSKQVDLNWEFTTEVTATPAEESKLKHKVGDNVYFDKIYTSSVSATALNPTINFGMITHVIDNAKNPYLINNGTGWINDACITTQSAKPYELLYKEGDVVEFSHIYKSSVSITQLNPTYKTGEITHVVKTAQNPYLINNGMGWVNDGVITKKVSSAVIKEGSKVKFNGNKDYYGKFIKAWHNDLGYTVSKITADSAILKYQNIVFAVVNIKDIELF